MYSKENRAANLKFHIMSKQGSSTTTENILFIS